MRHVAATDVEGPGERGRVGEHSAVGASGGDLSGEAGDLVPGQLAGEAEGLDLDLRRGRGGLVGPDGVDRVFLHRNEAAARLFERGAQAFGLGDGVQPRVEADGRAGAGMGGEPFRRRVVDQALDGEGRGVDLRRGLKRVAPVAEQRRALAHHQRRAGRPGEALGAGGDILALVLVGAGHEEAVEVGFGKAGAQAGNPVDALRGIGAYVEGLEHDGLSRLLCRPAAA